MVPEERAYTQQGGGIELERRIKETEELEARLEELEASLEQRTGA